MHTNNHLPDQPTGYALTLGVTGHRFLCQVDELIPRIDAVLDYIAAEWPGIALTIISALAEGSDRLVVARLLCRCHARLVVPLPLPEAMYIQDFLSASSRQEFWELLARADEIVRFPDTATRPAGYAVAGEYLLDHCDLLITLWDGQPAQGEGGTGAVVAGARQRGLPIVWIYTHNHKPGYSPPSISKAQGAVIFENF